MFMQQGNLLHFSVMLHDLCFIFRQMLLIVTCLCDANANRSLILNRIFFSANENYDLVLVIQCTGTVCVCDTQHAFSCCMKTRFLHSFICLSVITC